MKPKDYVLTEEASWDNCAEIFVELDAVRRERDDLLAERARWHEARDDAERYYHQMTAQCAAVEQHLALAVQAREGLVSRWKSLRMRLGMSMEQANIIASRIRRRGDLSAFGGPTAEDHEAQAATLTDSATEYAGILSIMDELETDAPAERQET